MSVANMKAIRSLFISHLLFLVWIYRSYRWVRRTKAYRSLRRLFHCCEHRHSPHVESESRLVWARPQTAIFISTTASEYGLLGANFHSRGSHKTHRLQHAEPHN